MPGGWLVLKLQSRQDAVEPSFDDPEVRDQAEMEVYQLKTSQQTLKMQLDLLNDAVITPHRYKQMIRVGLEAEIRKILTLLHG